MGAEWATCILQFSPSILTSIKRQTNQNSWIAGSVLQTEDVPEHEAKVELGSDLCGHKRRMSIRRAAKGFQIQRVTLKR